MSFKKNIISLSILGTAMGITSCSTCRHKDDLTLYPQNTQTQIRFPIHKGEASVGISLSYSISEQKDCELKNTYGDNYAQELIVGYTQQTVGEQLQYKSFENLKKSQEWQEKKVLKELKDYFSCFDINIFSVDLYHLRREAHCILKHPSFLAPGCYDYTERLHENE